MRQLLLRGFGPDTQASGQPPLADTRALAPWTHAQSNRRVVLHGVTVAYLLQRSRRRSIGFSVDDSGLTVHAPRRTSLTDIDAALRQKSGWIHAKLLAAEQRQQQLQASRVVWQDGARIPYLGQHLVLQVRPLATGAQPYAPTVQGSAGELTLVLPAASGADAEQLAALVKRWLQQQARALFVARLRHFAPALGVRWQRLRLSSARTRWGSASARGTISLHWRLIQLAPEIVDYVVVHELAHLLEMNHGPRFWAHVGRVLPDYEAHRTALRQVLLPPWA